MKTEKTEEPKTMEDSLKAETKDMITSILKRHHVPTELQNNLAKEVAELFDEDERNALAELSALREERDALERTVSGSEGEIQFLKNKINEIEKQSREYGQCCSEKTRQNKALVEERDKLKAGIVNHVNELKSLQCVFPEGLPVFTGIQEMIDKLEASISTSKPKQ